MRNPPSRALLAAAVGVLLLAGVAAPAVGGVAAAPSTSPSGQAIASSDLHATASPTAAAVTPGAAPAQTDDGFDSATATRIRIEPAPDRDARWTVSVRYALTDEADRAAFDTIGDRFGNGDIGPSADLFAGFAREASRNLNRTMRIEEVEREAVVHEDTSSFDVAGEDTVAVGELRLSFVWTAFLAQDGDELVLGDALTTPDGTWLRSLESGQTLEVTTPDGYTVTSTTASLRDNAVVIEGPRTFGEGDGVAVVYASTGTPGPPWTMLAAAIVIGALIIAGSIVGYRRRGGDDTPVAGDTAASTASAGAADTGTTGTADTGDGPATDPTETNRDDATADPDEVTDAGGSGERGAGDAAAGERADEPSDSDASDGTEAASPPDAGGSTASSASADEQTDEIDRSLLSDEERVEHLLDDNGGRMRQADIVSETGWSDAKVSQLLSAMADADRVEKLRLGRENLISLPDSGRPASGGSDADGDESDADSGTAGPDGDR